MLISEAGTIEVGKMRASRLTGPWPQNITPARAKAYSEDDYARASALLAQLRLVDGPLGIVAVETLEQLVGSILKASTHLSVWEGADVEARKWLMLSKGRHLTLARVRKRIWRNNAPSRAQRARLLAAEKKGDAWLKYWDGEARANRADARAQIGKRAKQHIRDLLVCFALAYKSAFTVGRVSPYSHVRAALWTKDARMWLPKTPIHKLVRLAKTEIARHGGNAELAWRGGHLARFRRVRPNHRARNSVSRATWSLKIPFVVAPPTSERSADAFML